MAVTYAETCALQLNCRRTTEFGIVIDVRPLHPEKAQFPILVTEFGIVIDVRPVQFWKTQAAILVTEFGIVIDVRPWQAQKA